MFYEEKIEFDRMYWRSTPDGEWIEFTRAGYISKIVELQAQLRAAREELAKL